MSTFGAYPTPSPTYGAPVVGMDPTAVMGRRIGAYLIDGLVVLLIAAAVVAVLFLTVKPYTKHTGLSTKGGASSWCDAHYYDSDAPQSGDLCFSSGDDTAYVVDLGGFGTVYGLLVAGTAAAWLLDYVLLQGLTGASVGKFCVGLRVVRQDGRICGVGWALLRTVLLYVDSFFCGVVGLVCASVSKGHRRLGDMAAGTLVVGKEHVGAPIAVPGYTTAEFPGAPYTAPPASGTAWPAPSSPSPQGAGWAQPSGQGGWPAPTPDSTAGAEAAAPTGDGPHWDEARQAYITYDRSRAAWLEYDQTTGTWGPIST